MKEEKNKIILNLSIAVLLAVVIEAVLVMSKTSFLSIDRVLVLIFTIFILGIHITMKKTKLYSFIVDNRFKISIVLFILSLVLGIGTVSFSEESVLLGNFNKYNHEMFLGFKEFLNIENNNLAEFLFLGFNNLKFFLMFLISYELCFIITKDKNMAVVGTTLISLSSYMILTLNPVIIFGELVLVFVYKFLNEKKEHKKENALYIAGILISMCLYGAWFDLSTIIAFAYVILAIFVSFVLLLKKEIKLEKKKIVSALVVLLIGVIALVVYHVCMVNFGFEQIVTNTNEVNRLDLTFGYGINVLQAFKGIENQENWFNFMSVFPAPIIIALVYLYKKEDHYEFLFPLSIVMVIEIVAASIGLPGILGSIILGFSLVSKYTAALMVSLMSVYLMIYILAHLEERAISYIGTIYLVLALIVVYFFVVKPVELSSLGMYYAFVLILTVLSLLIFNYPDKRYKKLFIVLIVLASIVSTITINPITKAHYADFMKYNEKNKTIEIKVEK